MSRSQFVRSFTLGLFSRYSCQLPSAGMPHPATGNGGSHVAGRRPRGDTDD